MEIAVVGVGAVGARVARQLVSTPEVDSTLVHDLDGERASAVVASMGERAHRASGEQLARAQVVVLATPAGTHHDLARAGIRSGQHVVSVADSADDAEALLGLDHEARERGVSVVVGAGFAPGLSCVLAAHAASQLDTIDEVHVAHLGTGGPACAHQHHRALTGHAVDWRDGGWVRRRSGSGRELVWFPDPIAGHDCYRASSGDVHLLVPAFAGVQRVTARLAATRRDRITAHLPMIRRPPAEGGPGALRVEVRGGRGPSREVVVLGAIDRPAVAAGAVAAVAALWAAGGRLRRHGAGGLAEMASPLPFLHDLRERGVRAAVFDGKVAASA